MASFVARLAKLEKALEKELRDLGKLKEGLQARMEGCGSILLQVKVLREALELVEADVQVPTGGKKGKRRKKKLTKKKVTSKKKAPTRRKKKKKTTTKKKTTRKGSGASSKSSTIAYQSKLPLEDMDTAFVQRLLKTKTPKESGKGRRPSEEILSVAAKFSTEQLEKRLATKKRRTRGKPAPAARRSSKRSSERKGEPETAAVANTGAVDSDMDTFE